MEFTERKWISILLGIILILTTVLSNGNKIFGTETATETLPQNINSIFLNGVTGDDNNSGQDRLTAVKTFEKAKEIAIANKNIQKIIVMGTVNISGEISLSGTNAKVMRDENFKDYLFNINNGDIATLKNIIIDGNGEGPKDKKSLIRVNGTLNIAEDAILENNKIINLPNKRTYGGGISGYSATINMTGGKIRNNQAISGGGIYLGNSSTMNFSGGTIENNRANAMYDSDVNQHYGSGGGIGIANGSTVNVSKNAMVLNNHSAEVGGGISVGDLDWSSKPDTLNMIGGRIEGNEAGSAGGGIFIQAGIGSKVSKGFISGGTIKNNKMTGSGRTNNAFGGGGIYVNGMPEKAFGSTWSNGELHLTNAVITKNRAKIAGGGLASCPVSKTFVYVKDGVAIYDNSSVSAKDFYLLSSKSYGIHSGEPVIKFSDRMLGGKPYEWKDDSGSLVDTEKYKNIVPNGTEIKLHTDNAYNDEEIGKIGKVFISGNTSQTRGGGIGSNGTIYIGDDKDKKDIEVEKTWGKGLSPKEIEVELIAKNDNSDYSLGRIKLNSENNFKGKFTNLPESIMGKKLEDTVYVKEISSDKYKAKIGEIREEKGKSILSFTIERPQMTVNENLSAVYSNYHMGHPETGVFNRSSWSLNNFNVKYNIFNVDKQLIKEGYMRYNADNYSWNGEASISGIETDSKNLIVEYYLSDSNNMIEPYLLEYNLYLEKRGDDTVLKVPRLVPDNIDNPTGNETVLKIKNGKISGESRNRLFKINILNEKVNPKISLSGEKKWDDKGDQDGIRPNEVTIKLIKNGVDTGISTKASKKTNWSYSFDNLDTYDGNGNKILYSVEEVAVPGYTSHKNGTTVINYHNPEIINIPVLKKWLDGNEKTFRPKSVKITLLANGEEIDNIVLNEISNWKGEFKNLPVNNQGKKIKYTIKEEPVKNYEASIVGDLEKGFIVTNINTSIRDILVTKKWKGKELESININLMRDGKKIDTAKILKSSNWIHSFKNLPVFDKKDGHKYIYTIEEQGNENYEAKITGDMEKGYTIINKEIKIPGKPVPKTGDKNSIEIYFMLSILTLGCILSQINKAKNKNGNK